MTFITDTVDDQYWIVITVNKRFDFALCLHFFMLRTKTAKEHKT